MLSEGPQGFKMSLLGVSWGHFGTTLARTWSHLAPSWAFQVPFGCPKSPPKPPKVTPFGTKAHQRVPKVAQDGPQDLILDHFGSFGESF